VYRQKKPEAEQMPNSKKWTQDLQRKYEMERDPEQRALMREFGQDLEKWITDGEIQEAQYLLSKGAEGEQEYARRHYEKIKAKIREQQERFGEQAMLEKYSEYKPTKKEADLWWLDLPYVLVRHWNYMNRT
jgi:predicted hydrolase (HD superfamily)